MSAPNKDKPPDFDEEFTQAVAKWREHHKLREDDAMLLLSNCFGFINIIGTRFAAGKCPRSTSSAPTSACSPSDQNISTGHGNPD